MNGITYALTAIVAIILVGVFLFFFLDRLERWQASKLRGDMQREAQRQRETERLVAQMLGFLAPGQTPELVTEEQLVDQHYNDEWFYATDEQIIDPTDQMNPDPHLPDPIDPETSL